MLHGYGILFLLFPPYWLFLGILLFVCSMAVAYPLKACFRIKPDQLYRQKKHAYFETVLYVTAIAFGAMTISLIGAFAISMACPYIGDINGEFIEYVEDADKKLFLYYAVWSILFSACLFPAKLVFNRAFLDRKKANRLFLCYDLILPPFFILMLWVVVLAVAFVLMRSFLSSYM